MAVERLQDTDLDAFAWIACNAYPGMQVFTAEDRQRWRERVARHRDEDPTVELYGVKRNGKLVGGMRLFDFVMNFAGTDLPLGGVGLVAVDLLHKKEHVAKELIEAFLRHYRERGTTICSLYAFRHDFYRQMGFGYGTKTSQYRLLPAKLPGGGSREGLRLLGADDLEQVLDCYEHVRRRTHGYFHRTHLALRRLLENEEARCIGRLTGDRVTGYLLFGFKSANPDNMFANNIQLHELVYEDRETLGALLMFLRTQADQIERVVFNTQDEFFHHLPLDARNGADNIFSLVHETDVQGLGIMYRLVDVPGFFRALRDHSWGGQSVRLRIDVEDSFLAENAGAVVLDVRGGRAEVREDGSHDVAIRLEIGELSSLVMGVIPFHRLYDYNLADISGPAAIPTITRLFQTAEKPRCLTRF